MIEMTLGKMRDSSVLLTAKEVLHIVNGRKKEEVGYFVPAAFGEEFEAFLQQTGERRKRTLLDRIARAQREDPIGDGVVGDHLGAG